MAEREEDVKMEEMRRNIVEQERQRLLREHAAKLLGYLPKVCGGTITMRACSVMTVTMWSAAWLLIAYQLSYVFSAVSVIHPPNGGATMLYTPGLD